ncbi:hypothetical protein NDU88_002303 [Pleurodeles waltl]|uniref:Uncharacterized protein n=1 Tax=Pleurodeles waltl TaxID=8319 RepID=A0AAV7P8N1_PLEWA|nr:hypothetical protein NDU88_002303 [Pleurodeles waltl]
MPRRGLGLGSSPPPLQMQEACGHPSARACCLRLQQALFHPVPGLLRLKGRRQLTSSGFRCSRATPPEGQAGTGGTEAARNFKPQVKFLLYSLLKRHLWDDIPVKPKKINARSNVYTGTAYMDVVWQGIG